MKKLLWVGDAACPSGFARATHGILDTLCKTYDVTVLGLNYNGDPHDYPYPIYACFPGGDTFGIGRLNWMCDRFEPDVIVLQNDGWNIPYYMNQLARVKEHKGIPVVAALAVDGKNFNGRWLDGVAHTVFWTRFAFNEARSGGYSGFASIIPLGVDIDAYKPTDRKAAREARKLQQLENAFIIGNVNRNQSRKRWDLTIKYFAKWIKANDIQNAWLYLHTAPTGDVGIDILRYAEYYEVWNRLALMTPETFYGVSEEEMRDTYNSFDVQVTTTQGEGFGLTTFEGMACGIPQIVPEWSALEELTAQAAIQIPCPTTGMPFQNVIGGVADEAKFIEALHVMYCNHELRQSMGGLALARAREDQFRWSTIGQQWLGVLEKVLYPRMPEKDWNDIERGESKVIGQIGVRQ